MAFGIEEADSNKQTTKSNSNSKSNSNLCEQCRTYLTARRFKVTASNRKHFDLRTASIGPALLGTAWIPAHRTALDSKLSSPPKKWFSQST